MKTRRCSRGTERAATDGQQPVVWLSTPSVYFHITSVMHREQESDREAENGHVNAPNVDSVPQYVVLIACQHMRGACY